MRNIRPCVSLGPWHPDNLGYYGPNAVNRARNVEFFANSRSKWARFWVSWQYLFPYKEMVDPSQSPPWPDPNIFEFGEDPVTYQENSSRWNIWDGMSPQLYLAQLDSQIINARRAGLNIVLTLYQTPRWTNRVRRKGWGSGIPFTDVATARLMPPDEANFRDSQWRLTLDSNAGRLLRFLVTRYSIYNTPPGGAPRNIDWLEVCNEANHQWQPTSGAWPEVAAWWIKLGWKAAKDWGGGSPTIFAPATADQALPANPTSIQLRRSYWRFTKDVFTHLRNGEVIYDVAGGPSAKVFNESDGNAGWSHHNYRDIEQGRYSVYDPPAGPLPDPNMTETGHNSARALVVWLKNNWNGWPNSPATPQEPNLALTEGGARVWVSPSSGPVMDVYAQRDKVSHIWHRHYNGRQPSEANSTGPDLELSRMIAMMTNYLFWSANQYTDGVLTNTYSGMCKPIDYHAPPEDRWLHGNPVDRPLFGSWAQFPTTAARGVKSFWGWMPLQGVGKYSPDIVSRHPGHLEIFGVGYFDNHVYHKWWFDWGGWSGWEDLGGHATSSVGTCAPSTSRQSVFARADDNNVWEGTWNGSYWELYHYRGSPPPGTASGVDANSVRRDDHKEIFVRGGDGALWHRWAFNGSWSNWESLGGDCRSDPTTVAWGNPDRVYAFHTTSPDSSGDRIRWVGYDVGVGWRDIGMIKGPRVRPGGTRVVKGIDVTSQGRDQMDLFAWGPDDCYWRLHYENGAWAEEWEWLGGPQGEGQNYRMYSEPSACSWGQDRIDLIGFGQNGQTWWTGYAPGG